MTIPATQMVRQAPTIPPRSRQNLPDSVSAQQGKARKLTATFGEQRIGRASLSMHFIKGTIEGIRHCPGLRASTRKIR